MFAWKCKAALLILNQAALRGGGWGETPVFTSASKPGCYEQRYKDMDLENKPLLCGMLKIKLTDISLLPQETCDEKETTCLLQLLF